MKVGIGSSRRRGSREAAQEAAQRALATMVGSTEPAWALAFAGRLQAPADVLLGVRDILGQVPVVGGAAVGTITLGHAGYGGSEVVVAAFPRGETPPTFLVQDALDRDERAAGRELGRRLAATAPRDSQVMLFYDSIRSFGPPPVLNVGSLLLKGLHEGLDGHRLTVFGAGLVQDLELSASHVLDGDAPRKQVAVAVVLPPPTRSRTLVLHGCTPVSGYHRITAVDGPVVRELDGRPALDVVEAFLGGPGSAALDVLSLSLTLGSRLGDPGAPDDESDYVNRLILAPLPDQRALLLFEADFEAGAQVQFMSRSNDLMIDSVRRATARLAAEGDLDSVSLALYADCAGRCAAFNGAAVEEADILARGLPEGFPLLGFYSGVEIAPMHGRSRPLDWTGALTLLRM